jgi:hypothetical protein
MAVSEQDIFKVRERMGENGPTSQWTNDMIIDKINEAEGSLLMAAALGWESKAAALANLVNSSEGSSNRSLGDLYKNALAMADRLRRLALGDKTPDADDNNTSSQPGNTRIGKIVRA